MMITGVALSVTALNARGMSCAAVQTSLTPAIQTGPLGVVIRTALSSRSRTPLLVNAWNTLGPFSVRS
jgi:hypothetical protein